jgi:hypothetical protein
MAGIVLPLIIGGIATIILPNIIPPNTIPLNTIPPNTQKIPEYNENPIEMGDIVTKPLVLNSVMKKEVDDILTAINIDTDELEQMKIMYEKTNDPKLKQKIIDNLTNDDIKTVAEEEAIILKDIIDDETKKLNEAGYEKSIIYNKIIATKESDIPESEKQLIISQLEKKLEEIDNRVNKNLDSMIDTISEFETQIKNLVLDNIFIPPEISSPPQEYLPEISSTYYSIPYPEVSSMNILPQDPPPDMTWFNYVEQGYSPLRPSTPVQEDTAFEVFNRDPY